MNTALALGFIALLIALAVGLARLRVRRRQLAKLEIAGLPAQAAFGSVLAGEVQLEPHQPLGEAALTVTLELVRTALKPWGDREVLRREVLRRETQTLEPARPWQPGEVCRRGFRFELPSRAELTDVDPEVDAVTAEIVVRLERRGVNPQARAEVAVG